MSSALYKRGVLGKPKEEPTLLYAAVTQIVPIISNQLTAGI